MSNYYEWAGFSNVYLEDSFIIQISESDTELVFDIEFVLTEDHPLFEQPKAAEQYCYRTGKLVFSGVSSVNWKKKSNLRFSDANDEEDYGNIDVLRRISDEVYEISGDWGDLEVVSSQVEIIFD